jgi:hypothetical protein
VPFLRVIRDKRGYETTYLMHWFRDGQRQRSRILYVFRSPGGVRVGRQVLEPEVMREIEANHPDVEFDWASVREHKQVIETAPEPRRKRRSEDAPRPKPSPEAAAPAQQPQRPAVPAKLSKATLPPSKWRFWRRGTRSCAIASSSARPIRPVERRCWRWRSG